MMWTQLAIVLLAVVIAVGVEIAERIRVRRLTCRPCAGVRWHREFPNAPHDEIRSFLRLFSGAFSFDERHSLAFRPDDYILDVYHARNIPHITLDDLGELEEFAAAVKHKYTLDLETHWREDLTLGEVFSLTQATPGRSPGT